MDETTTYVLSTFHNSKEAIMAIDLKGKVLFWSKGAELMFGYKSNNILGRELPFAKESLEKEFKITVEKINNNEDVCLKTFRDTKNGNRVEVIVNTYPLIVEGSVVGFSSVCYNLSKIKKAYNLNATSKDTKRTFVELRKIILSCLTRGRMTINQVSNKSGVNWKTVEKHLTFLIGKGYVEEVFSSEYVRIFELTEKGQKYVITFQKESVSKIIKEETEEIKEYEYNVR